MENTVFWITGLSGPGKTTIGKRLYMRLRERGFPVVMLDGDSMRAVFGDVFGYSEDERRKCAMCYSRLCKMLAEQGITVVCCTISMFDSVRSWNRENISDYVEVYIKTSLKTLIKRDQKGLYSGLQEGASSNVPGMDMRFEEPKMPDVVIDNDGNISIDECVDYILKAEKAHMISLRNHSQ